MRNADTPQTPDFGKVAVLMGGVSAEREVSLHGGTRVLAALRRQGVDAYPFDPAEKRLEEIDAFDRAFIVLHGRYGEDGTLQGLLEQLRIPYTGSGVLASALGMDKWRSKLLWRAAGLSVPDCVLLKRDSDFARVGKELGFPLFVKPAREGSSIGVSLVKKAAEMLPAYELASKYDASVLAERGLFGGEYTVAIVGDDVLPSIRIDAATEFYDYDAKYLREDTTYLCPSDLSEARESELRAAALEAFRTLGGRGWGRIDFLMDEAGKAYLLEANTVPGMTDHSLVPMAARAAGISYDRLVMRVLEEAMLG
ncbi:MAG: D-alanine--D-alanine ligase [Candidatus Accumulibacter sp.]|jgi:D-alanine-D-alanine ligase|nr:D-alanine--D-alanine ligase [Accumulibacter sp.]